MYSVPKFTEVFINEFSNFLSFMVTKSDNLFILVDFNNPICCPSNPLARDFRHLNDCFSLAQLVMGPTLDLILTFGVPISNVQIRDVSLSDH